MENTLENRAKFFALYCGQKVLYVEGIGLVNIGSGAWNLRHPDLSFLELKQLSSISDEYAEYCIGKVECHLRKNDPKHSDYGMSPSGIFVNSIIGDSSYHIGIREADYLRSKGYALPWMGLSVQQLINYGWIKLNKG